jgi:lipoprotein-releasing system permease protein
MQVFLLQGGFFGLAGSLFGVGLAWALVAFFSRITRNADGSALISAEIEPSVILGACALALVVGVLAAALPARRAAKLDPVQAIRM